MGAIRRCAGHFDIKRERAPERNGHPDEFLKTAGHIQPEVCFVRGDLVEISAIIAARRVDRLEVRDRFSNAERLANDLGRDANHGWTGFGPINVAIHRTSAAAETGDPLDVLKSATMIDTSAMPEGLKGRRSNLQLDLAWAQVQQRRDPEAVLHLLEVERIATETRRYHRRVVASAPSSLSPVRVGVLPVLRTHLLVPVTHVTNVCADRGTNARQPRACSGSCERPTDPRHMSAT